MPDILDEEHLGVDDALYSTQPLAASWKSPKAVAKQLELISERLGNRQVAFFSRYDSISSSFSYGYAKLKFSNAIENEAKGEFQYIVYSVKNSKGEIQKLNIARIPKGAMARASYLNWMGITEGTAAIAGKTGVVADKTASSCSVPREVVCFDWYVINEDGYIQNHETCYEFCPVGGWPTTEPPPPNSGGEPNECWVVGVCMPNGGIRTMPTLTDCAGVVGGSAEMDGCNRCVGGTTGRLPAEPPMCSVIPCKGDPLREPRITSPGNSGLNGGRFRVGSNAVRNSGSRSHYGLDISCTIGAPIFAPVAGSVVSLETNVVGYGIRLIVSTIIGGQKRYLAFNHINGSSMLPGAHFASGDILANCGRTGIVDPSTKTHVHIEYSTNQSFNQAFSQQKMDPEPLITTKYGPTGTAINPNPCNQ